ncbi:MAG: arsenic resistance N-acetyltransferase ArsN2 [Chloroflexales bacterium]
MATTITPADPADLPAILDLLTQHGLPHAGLAQHMDAALVARDGAAIIGSAALERYGDAALLRSVAVAPARRGHGLGQRLTAAALDLAHRLGVRQLYLLTTTAEGYFPRFGFRPITRAEVAPAVQASAEFTGACPASAVVLALDLPPAHVRP